jgi:hypothetical protein
MTRQGAVLAIVCGIGAGCGASGPNDNEVAAETEHPLELTDGASARLQLKQTGADSVTAPLSREPLILLDGDPPTATTRPTRPTPIVNPTPVGAGDLLGMVQVTTWQGFCSGVVIASDTVLTAGHCVCTHSEIGGNVCNPAVSVSFRPDPTTGVVTTVNGHATWHPDYDPSWIDSRVNNDLAVVKLEQPSPAYVPSFRLPVANLSAGSKVLIAGFGHTGHDCNGPLGALNSDVVNIDDYEDSGKTMTFFDPVFCPGDSGGAILDPNGRTVHGIVSSEVLTLLHGSVDKAIATAPYHDWIASFLPPFITFVQSYTDPALALDFGLPSSWDAISGDFDHDGKGDYARVGATGAWVFFGNGDGSFTRAFQSYVDEAPPLDFGAPSPWETITGDFNGDGHTDYARVGSTGAWLFFGNANRTFTRGFQSYVDEAPALDFGAPSPWETITGDFNGDGRTDYARVGSTGVWLFFGNADGTFTRGFQSYVDQSPPLNFGLPSTWRPIAGDFNGDGKTDYARVGDTDAWLFFGNANGTFTRGFQSYVDQSPPLSFGEGATTWQPITGDFNGDGKGDYARLGSTGAWLFYGNADGTFTRGFQTYDGVAFGDPSAYQVLTGNFGGDGRTAYARLGGTRAYVFLHP